MELFSDPLREVVFVCFGYALGCIPTGYCLVRLRTGEDIRSIGSGSTGSTNVGRVLGRAGYAATLVGDISKAAIATWTAVHFGVASWGLAAVMIAILAGHIWPIQLGFQGGKGLAPGIGILAILDYRAVLIAGGIAATGPLVGKGKATLIFAAMATPLIVALLHHSKAEIAGQTVLVFLVLIAHRDNIRAFFSERRNRKGLQA
jgi:acyl phosphate:glycerol-3-phosphate acyltransferase